jgi:hypothetical protein
VTRKLSVSLCVFRAPLQQQKNAEYLQTIRRKYRKATGGLNRLATGTDHITIWGYSSWGNCHGSEQCEVGYRNYGAYDAEVLGVNSFDANNGVKLYEDIVGIFLRLPYTF